MKNQTKHTDESGPQTVTEFIKVQNGQETIQIGFTNQKISAHAGLSTFASYLHWHRFKYRLGVKEPPIAQIGRGGVVDPITRGNIVHDVLEQYAEEAELEGLLEAAIGR